MQNPGSKILKYIFILFLAGIQTAQSQSVTNQLQTADSLFDSKKYTESLSIYDDILETTGKASPAMLLKMAYINEALENFGEALYHLNNYYSLTADDRALTKMRDLAATKDLEGYDASNLDYLLKFYSQYRFLFVGVFVALGILIVAMIYRQKKKHSKPAPTLGVALVLVLLIGIYLTNFSGIKHKGIISGTNTYLMTGPSAGSDLVEVVGEGHKVEILDQQDIWVEIKWKGRRAYVREYNIKALP
jgi:hypothetical protein